MRATTFLSKWCFSRPANPLQLNQCRVFFGSSSEKHLRGREGRNRSAAERHEQETDFNDSVFRHKRRGERFDSVTEAILHERDRHEERITEQDSVDAKEQYEAVAGRLAKLGLGRKKKGGDTKKVYDLGATGSTHFLTSCAKAPWPRFKHMLPEVAFAGHSNSGKSTLLNTLAGLSRGKGVARVSDRAGWTDALFWYQVGAKPPIMSLVDLPGYGHAVVEPKAKAQWFASTRSYLASRRVLSRVCVLVDCTRGVGAEDAELLHFLNLKRVPHQVVLTMGDLLTPMQLAKCVALVSADLEDIEAAAVSNKEKPASSSSSSSVGGAGGGLDGESQRQSSPSSPFSSSESSSPPSPPSFSSTAPSSTQPPSAPPPRMAEKKLPSVRHANIPVVSGHTGAGVQGLWRELLECTEAVSSKTGVPVHISERR
eukprot:CAMPEP_0171936840 /NCGR_PEP_ID=MMETSP0993-20121228/34092_1 /TAXON_ID=483369 /ORGANISM="non described non described, Strain CCMP2098" /LENGTH=425 /DNA_ID=CAMNT_0012578069 /DNA_START=33 /DNA_END=1310 /DNA_ORIENTATION=+